MRVEVQREADIVIARCAGRDACRDMGFGEAAQIKVATAISELARNIVQYAGSGQVVIRALPSGRPGIEVTASDNGPGIDDVELAMSARYASRTGMGIGLKGTRNLMDDFTVVTRRGQGTVITVRKYVA